MTVGTWCGATTTNHHANHTDEFFQLINEASDRFGPPIGRAPASIVQFFHNWLDGNGYPIWPFWDHVLSWWHILSLPNVLLLHFADLKKDLPGAIRRVAAFLEIPLDDELLAVVARHASFKHMKANAARYAPRNGRVWRGGAKTFIHKGTNARWRNELPAEECRRYEAISEARLGKPCATWLAEGGPIGHPTLQD